MELIKTLTATCKYYQGDNELQYRVIRVSGRDLRLEFLDPDNKWKPITDEATKEALMNAWLSW